MGFELGIAGGPIPLHATAFVPALAARLARVGVTTAVTHVDPDPTVLTRADAERVRDVLAAEGIRIVQAGGFRVSLVEPDDALRRKGLARLRPVLDRVADLGAGAFITGCGSLHPDSFYGPHPDNHLPATRDRLVASLQTVAGWATEAGTSIALECHQLTTLDDPTHIREILDAVDSPSVHANFDPVNLLASAADVYASAERMEHMVSTIGPRYGPCAHAKDVTIGLDHPVHLREAAPGEGLLAWRAFFDACARLGDRTPVIVEHLPADRAIAALSTLVELAAEAGHSLG